MKILPFVSSLHSLPRFVLAATLALSLIQSASAAIYAEYLFNDGTANDTSGNNFHGTVVDPQNIASYTGGQLDLRANDGFSSNQDFALPTAEGAYVDLPNNLISGASTAGTNLDLSIEVWFTEQVHRNWARVFDFGTSSVGEDDSSGGLDGAYIMATTGSNAGGPADNFIVETHNPGVGLQFPNDGAAEPALTEPPLPVGQTQHLVVTLSQAGTTGGAGDNGTATAYVNGTSVGSAPIVDGLFIDLMTNDNNWLGRSQWPDQLFDGTYDQVRIYDNALSATQVLNSFNDGVVQVPFPAVEVNRNTGEITITNPTADPISLTSYSILSADGALDIASWDSIQPASGWTRTSQVETDASEAGGTAQVLSAGGSLSLGDLWFQTPIEDLVFNFTTTGASGAGVVTYTGDAIARSDLNGDGSINADDWSIFLGSNETSLNTTLPVAAYLQGDLDADLDNDRLDFLIFKGDFIAANGAQAFAELVGVPEPMSALYCGIAAAIAVLQRRRS